MSIRRRLGNLEESARTSNEEAQDRVSREALGRISTEDLWLVHAYLKRAVEEGGTEPTKEERPALRRYEEIQEEVRNEQATTH